jgi:hypothetical protein
VHAGIRTGIVVLVCLAAPLAVAEGSGNGIPIPRPKPQRPAKADIWPEATILAEVASCRKILNGLDISWKPLKPIGQPGGCGAPAPVEVSRVDGAAIKPPAVLTCKMAAALHEWVSGSVQPAAKSSSGTTVATIHNAASYVCRSRNNVSGAKLSEHAKANAFDMSGFSFATGKGSSVGDGWGGLLSKAGLSPGGTFLDKIRSEACATFTTVLGPGSDPYHGTHFHVDILQRKGGYRVCQ